MASTWSSRRKKWYAIIVIVLVIVIVGVPSFLSLYRVPTCTDGKQNGGELGVDCGGACKKLCSSSFVPVPSPSWVRLKEVSSNDYNVAAYIVNPNPKGTAKDVPYTIELLDKDAVTIATKKGFITLPPGRNTLAFEANVDTGLQRPVRATFRFTGEPDWILASDPLALLDTAKKDYREGDAESSLVVTLMNKGATPLENITVFVVLKDKDGTVLDFSKTVVDEIRAGKTADAPFTWPGNHDNNVISIEVLPVAE